MRSSCHPYARFWSRLPNLPSCQSPIPAVAFAWICRATSGCGYGKFDSMYVNPNTEKDRADKLTVEAPAIPVTWPTGAGFSENRNYTIYTNETYSRRVVRVDKIFAVEAVCALLE